MRETLASIDARDVGMILLLTAVVLQHAGTAGIHACMGRDGLIHHRRIELIGAIRGTVALVALLAPVAAVWALDALSSAARLDVYLRASEAMLWLWLPLSAIALVSFLVARWSPWQVRSNVNSMIFSVLELSRPVVAVGGAIIAAFATADARVAAVAVWAVLMGLQVSLVTRWSWYSSPVTLEDLGTEVSVGREN